MRGYIAERRPGVWRIVISAGANPSGKRRQIVRTVHGSRRDAERERTRMLRNLDEGRLADGRQPLERYLEGWLADVSTVSRRGTPLAPTTRQRYRDSVRHISREIGKVRMIDLRASHVEHLRDALLARALGPESVSGVLRVLSQALARAEAKELVGRNWADASLVHRPAGRPADFAVVDPELGSRILVAATGTQWDAPVHLALGLGLRREEVLGLGWEHVADGVVSIRRTLTAAEGELHFGPPKSAAGRRDLPLPDFVASAVERHRIAQGERLLALGIRDPDLVIDNGLGQPWQPASFSAAWKGWAAAHGFSGITFHTLRHGAATLLLASGAPDAVSAAILGHADTKILRRYQDVVAELKRDAASGMDELLGHSR